PLDNQRALQRAGECTDGPAAVQPAVASHSRMQYAIAQRGGGDTLGQHAGDKNRPRDSEQHDIAPVPEVVNSLSKLVQVSRQGIALNVRWKLARFDCDFSLPHSKVTDQRYRVSRPAQCEDTAKLDALVHKSHNGSGNHPPTLHSGQKDSVRAYEVRFG